LNPPLFFKLNLTNIVFFLNLDRTTRTTRVHNDELLGAISAKFMATPELNHIGTRDVVGQTDPTLSDRFTECIFSKKEFNFWEGKVS